MCSLCWSLLFTLCLCGAVGQEILQAPERPSVKLLVIGRTGSGKSTLINNVLGREVAKVGHTPYPETKYVQVYHEDIYGVSVTVCDTPGLGDATSMERDYLNEIKASRPCHDPDLVLFCLSMDNPRWLDDDLSAIKSVTEHFGSDIWKHFVLVLTFADRYLRNIPANVNKTERLQQRKHQLTKIFQEGLSEVGVTSESNEHRLYSAVSANDTKSLLVFNWLSGLFATCLSCTNDSGRDGLLKIVLSRIEEENIPITDSLLCSILQWNPGPWIFGALCSKWLITKFGTIIGGPAGFVVGGLAGYGLEYMISQFVCSDWNSHDEL